MRKISITLIIAFITIKLFAQVNTQYNKALADSLGANEFGMKSYILVILKTGTNTTSNKAFVDSCFAGHMKNINALAEQGKLTIAGPIAKNDKNYRGIFILNVSTFLEAEKLMEGDAAITSKLLDAEMFKWFGSAALPMYLPYHNKINKTKN